MNKPHPTGGDGNSPKLTIDIVSDVVCPWCIVGYKQLERALASWAPPRDVALRWHPFELNPTMPAEGQNLREHLAEKAGITPAQSQAARERLTALGDALGFAFNFHDAMRIANTFRAHQLLHWAGELGLQTALKLALFSAYFSRRENINDPSILVATAADVGLPAAEARAVLEDERYAALVRSEESAWRARGISGVPAFIFNQRYAVTGAQDADTFLRILEQTEERAKQA